MTATAAAPWPTQADLGGRTDGGPVVRDPHEPAFHAPWEREAFALTLAMGATGQWNLDMSRAARETLPDYPALGYYAIWFEALQRLLLERGLVAPEELGGTPSAQPPRPLARVLRAEAVPEALRRGAPTERAPQAPARFAPGDFVRTRDHPVPHHTRLPAYARGRRGTVMQRHGVHVLPDHHAQGLGEAPTWLYRVRFEAAELWGTETSACSVTLDLWEPYLMPGDADA